MSMFAAEPSEQVCRLALDNNCHMPKKGHHVCKSCWSIADDCQKETVKDFVEGYCTVVGCFEWASGGASVCNEHDALTMSSCTLLTSETKNQVVQMQEVKQELRKKARQQDQHESLSSEPSESQSSEPSRKLQKSADGGASAARMCTAALQDLSTPDLGRFSENCIRELASRAPCSVLS